MFFSSLVLTQRPLQLLSEQPSSSSAGDAAQEARLKATVARSKTGAAPPAAAEVTFAGTISYSGSASGSIELEVLDNSWSGEPILMGRQKLTELGPFSIDVKSESSELMLMAYLDLTETVISDDDPRGYLKISDATQSAEGLEVVILDLDALEKNKDGKGDVIPKKRKTRRKRRTRRSRIRNREKIQHPKHRLNLAFEKPPLRFG